jgi:hypothetical protein
MQTSESIELISAALVKAQSELAHAVKDSPNEAFKRGGKAMKYADLSAVWDAAKPVLKANDLAALQDTVNTEAGIGVRTRILHKSGQWIEFEPPIIPLTQKTAHGVGSATTYGRRYSLSAALGVVADEDDDGNAASMPANGNGAQAPEPQAKNAPGVTKAREWVSSHLRHLHGSEDGTDLMLRIAAEVSYWARIKTVYPALWTGPDQTGLHGEARKIAATFQCLSEFDAFIKSLENPQKEAAE